MQKLNFKWKNQTGQYQNGVDLYLNRIHLGSVSWNAGMSKFDPDKEKKQYIGGSHLYPSKRWEGATKEEVQAIIEQKITAWFNEALTSEV